MNTEQQVKDIVQQTVADIDPNIHIDNTTSLVVSGLLSSLQIIDLASTLEAKFGLDFAVRGFNQYDFENINSIINMLES